MSQASQKRARGADAIDLTTEDVSPREKKMRESINGVAAELLCPITQELPFDPVMAKDGKIYERTAILEWFRKKDGDATSPSTGKVIGTELLPAVQTKNTIEMLIKSGAIAGELATAWTEKLEQEKVVKRLRAQAEGGNGEAMYLLGAWYEYGENGVAKDEVQARAWYELSAATRDPRGMGTYGECLLCGVGGPKDNVFGVMNVTAAAELGSNLGAYRLGWAFFEGGHGLPKDPARARFWLKKIFDGEYEYKHLTDTARADAARMLRELDQ
uniref:U-box domain-containing protein n=1 Tax=Pelagomonas calceolata TaxID=35677 RepID=A0A7S3ZVH5_9STRA